MAHAVPVATVLEKEPRVLTHKHQEVVWDTEYGWAYMRPQILLP